jgi:hypothetical protein
MAITIEALIARIETLESKIQSFYQKPCASKTKHSSAFANFAHTFTPHVRSALFHNNFICTRNLHFKPTHAQIIKEISLMWNALTLDEKLHFS